jgi:hypothetical protein
MPQADSVPSSSRQLITAESANQSTTLRAVNLPAIRVEPASHYLIGGSHPSTVIGGDEAPLLRFWREKRDDEPDGLLKRRCYGANAGQAPVGWNSEALFYANAPFSVGRLLRKIVQILLLFVRRNKRLRNGAPDKASLNQLVRSNAQEKLK